MFARKLGRVAGLVFVLAAVFGGVAVSASGAEADSTAADRSSYSAPTQTANFGVEWD
ncbi:hypothetical protein OWR29_07235 [Actinoplanes sp. Pm04-4]|uniref:Uncharacterized protein n=1 Tax=Paractinoplanes pyxinae TaxID=2997416 RepID=A0ABT4AVB6_9ACTN|nr:hypothetical protein [Actinoplanes pyxinae]MCY1137787.1 hypothetical protein [Actinoplanes pyxinae]